MCDEDYSFAGLGCRLDFAFWKSAFLLGWNPVRPIQPVEIPLAGLGAIPATPNTPVTHLGGLGGHVGANLQSEWLVSRVSMSAMEELGLKSTSTDRHPNE